MQEKFKKVEGEIIPFYENEKGEKLINARELHQKLGNKRKFADWIKQRINQYDFIENSEFFPFHNFVKGDEKGYGNKKQFDYYITIDMAKELCMVENNEIGKSLRKYFIEVEKRYQKIVEAPQNIFDIMHLALNQIEENERKLNVLQNITQKNSEKIEEIQKKVDVIIKKDYVLASDIAEQIQVYSENNLPHSNFVSAIARILGMKISYKHYYEDEEIAIVPDKSKGNEYYQIYYKPKAVDKILKWFEKNKEEIEYKIIYERNTKNGKKGEIKEKGYKIEKVCYKVK